MNKRVIASYCLCSTVSINIYDIEYGITDRVLAGMNDEEPEWFDIDNGSDGMIDSETGEDISGFWFHDDFIPFNGCMRV